MKRNRFVALVVSAAALGVGAGPAMADAPASGQVSEQTAANEQSAQSGATSTQYGPSNTNISVRVLSPGDNGSVTQTQHVHRRVRRRQWQLHRAGGRAAAGRLRWRRGAGGRSEGRQRSVGGLPGGLHAGQAHQSQHLGAGSQPWRRRRRLAEQRVGRQVVRGQREPARAGDPAGAGRVAVLLARRARRPQGLRSQVLRGLGLGSRQPDSTRTRPRTPSPRPSRSSTSRRTTRSPCAC